MLAALIMAAAGLAQSAPAAPDTDCFMSLDAISQAVPQFESFPSKPVTISRPAKVDLASDPQARPFRTKLASEARVGPNFAGGYTIAGWGCGTSCMQWAVVSVATGAVHFEPSVEIISADQVGEEKAPTPGVNYDYYTLRFRLDSNLLIVLGAPNEDEARAGVGFYQWTGKAFKLLEFVPLAQVCHGRAG